MNTRQIGENAGKVWKVLAKNGGASTKELSKELNLKTEDVHLAVGWLARENKLHLLEKDRNTFVQLTDSEKNVSKTALTM